MRTRRDTPAEWEAWAWIVALAMFLYGVLLLIESFT